MLPEDCFSTGALWKGALWALPKNGKLCGLDHDVAFWDCTTKLQDLMPFILVD